jgi:hypothetical protein
MKLKQKLSMMAVAVGLAFAGQASALTLPNTNNGSLWLTVWDTATGATNSYARDLGVTINQFLPTGITGVAGDGSPVGNRTPESGLTLNFATDPLFASTFSSIPLANLAWNIYGADSVVGGAAGQARIVTTAVTGTTNAPTFSQANVSAGALKANEVGNTLNTVYGCGAATSCAVTDGGSAFGGGSNWGNSVGGTTGTLQTSGAIGSLLNFFYFASNGTSGFTQANGKTVFANSQGRATWSLDNSGNLTYALAGGPSAVPVPAAAWLLGSGLLGLVGVARRRKSQVA